MKKEVTIRPTVFKNREDRDRAQMLLARKALTEMLDAALRQWGQCAPPRRA
jgi:hypothetical protein